MISGLFERLKALNLRKVLSVQLESGLTLRSVPYWFAAVLVGLFAVIYSGAYSAAIQIGQTLASTKPILFFVLAPACFVLGTWVVEKFSPAPVGTRSSPGDPRPAARVCLLAA